MPNIGPKIHNTLTDIPGIKVGHWTALEAGTGCTVVLCAEGAVAGVDVRGGAPGTREIALLDPVCTVQSVHAILLSGGSAFGLAAADGVVRWLEEQDYGYDASIAKIPIVPAAILFDLAVGSAQVRPTAESGYQACVAADDGPMTQGSIGAGTGATVGKLLGPGQVTKSGIGSASRQLGEDVFVSALVAVNAIGDVIDPQTQQIIAGARSPDGDGFADTMQFIEQSLGQPAKQAPPRPTEIPGTNTTIAVIATNIRLDKAGATKVAQMAHDGLARVIRPIHTALDGDTVFALSMGDKPGNAGMVGAIAADVLAEAVINGIQAATSLHGLPSYQDLMNCE